MFAIIIIYVIVVIGEEEMNFDLEIEKSISKLNDLYNRANTKGKKKLICADLMLFEEIYSKLYPFSNRKMLWSGDSEIYRIAQECQLSYDEKFVTKIMEKEPFYENLALGVLSGFEKCNYDFYRFNSTCSDLPRVKMEDILFLLNDFTKYLGKRYNDYFNLKYKDYEILITDVIDAENYTCGITLQLDALKRNYIFLDGKAVGDNILMASILAHEFGHAVEMNINSISNNMTINQLAFSTPFYEVSSSFFENAFLNYLIENKLFVNSANRCLDFYYKSMFSNFSQMLAIAKMRDISLTDGCFVLNDDEVIKCLDIIKEDFNYYSLPSKGDILSYINTYIYGLGSLASIYMYDCFLNDKEKFMYEFDKVLSIYQHTNSLDSFDKVGLSEDRIQNGKVLIRTLKKYTDSVSRE